MQEGVGDDRDNCAKRKEEERGDRRFPGRATQLFRVDAQLIAAERIQGDLAVAHDLLR